MTAPKPNQPRGLPIPIPDSERCPPKLKKAIDGLAGGERLSPSDRQKLFSEIGQSQAARDYYDRVMSGMRRFEAGSASGVGLLEPSSVELDLVAENVLAIIGAQTAEAAKKERSTTASSLFGRGSLFVWAAGLVGAALAVLLALPLLRPQTATPPTVEEPRAFQARGAAPKKGKLVGIRAFCIGKKIRELEDNKSCELSAQLSFAFTNRSTLSHLFLLGVDKDKRLMWYVPGSTSITTLEAFAYMLSFRTRRLTLRR
jgi:hypothetical protein